MPTSKTQTKTKKTSVKTQKSSVKKKSDTKYPRPNDVLLSQKIKQFIAEVGEKELTPEQSCIYKAFTKTKGSATYIDVTTRKGKSFKVKIYSNKFSNGVQYILMGHYKTTREYVTANEILNLCDVIRKGEEYFSRGYTVYKLSHKYNNVTIRTVLKIDIKGKEAVLKSFHSDR